MARGLYGRAYSHYQRALDTAAAEHLDVEQIPGLSQRHRLAALKTDRIQDDLDSLQCFLDLQARSFPETVELLRIAIFLQSKTGHEKALCFAANVRTTLEEYSQWRACCDLALAMAEAWTRLNRPENTVEHLDFVMRLASQYGNPVDAADSFLLAAENAFCEGRFFEARTALRFVSSLLRRMRPAGKSSIVHALQAKIALFQGKPRRAAILGGRAAHAGSCSGAMEAVMESTRVVACAAMSFGGYARARRLLEGIVQPNLRISQLETLAPSCVVLASACYAEGEFNRGERFRRIAEAARSLRDVPREDILILLTSSEMHLMRERTKEAMADAQRAKDRSNDTQNKPLRAIARYQLIKVSILIGHITAAKEELSMAEEQFPFAYDGMWRPLRQVVRTGKPSLKLLKPIGCFTV